MGIEYGEKRRLKVDGQYVRKASDFIGRLNVVAFVPEDIDLIKGPASSRRRFLDVSLTQTAPTYLQTLQSYEKALKSRNALLRLPNPTASALAAYDHVLVDCGSRLIYHRQQFFQRYVSFLTVAASDLFPADRHVSLRYQTVGGISKESTVEDISALLRDGLAANIDRDRKYGQTHCGPHRDDFLLNLDGRLLGDFGSEGQCRLAAMALKLAKARLMFDVKGEESVILLVDDVIGELDERGCQAFMTCVSLADQAFIACTDANALYGVENPRIFRITNGTAIPTETIGRSDGTAEEE